MTSVIIACGSKKRTSATTARDLYIGSIFLMARRAAESTGLPWFIMSAKYGIVSPDRVIEPYDMTYGKSRGVRPKEIREQLEALAAPLPIWALTPQRYTEVLRAAAGSDQVRDPLRGLGMGYQLQTLKRIAEAGSIEKGLGRVSH